MRTRPWSKSRAAQDEIAEERRMKNDGKTSHRLTREARSDMGEDDPLFVVWDDIYRSEDDPQAIRAINAEDAAAHFGYMMGWKNQAMSHLVYVREPDGNVTMWGVRPTGCGNFQANLTCVG